MSFSRLREPGNVSYGLLFSSYRYCQRKSNCMMTINYILHPEFTKIKTLPHNYNDTKIRRKQRPSWPTNQRKKGPDTWLQKSTCLDQCPAVGGVSIAGEEEVTGLHWTHGLVELKGSYSYELSLLDRFVVCRLTFYILWMGAIFSPSTVLLRRPHQQILAMFA